MKERLTVSISTLGCRSNQYDSSALEDMIREGDFRIIPFPGPADAYIINTCTVTGRTDYQSRQLIRRARRMNPDAVVIVTGCYAQVSSDEVSRIEGVDYIVGNPEKERIVEYLHMGRQKGAPLKFVSDGEGTPLRLRARSSRGRSRVNLKVQDGCNRRCSYCIIPLARGRARSLPPEEVFTEIEALIERGYREIVLTGIHLGAYGLDLPGGWDITGLVTAIEHRGYPCRFRLSSIEPDEITDGLIEVLASASTICNHLHLPLQSGDDTILSRMNRPYTGRAFARVVDRLHTTVKGISIGVDVIAGFPGEDDRGFENTFSLIRDLPISYLHIFPFSRRRGTPAYHYPGQVPPDVVKARCQRLRALDGEKREGFFSKFLGERMGVVVESPVERRGGTFRGRTRNYIPVLFDGGGGFTGREVEVVLTGIDGRYMTGIFEG